MVKTPLAQEYVKARDILIEALEALGSHREAIILVGAQAIYMQVGEGNFGVPPYTTDADLVLNPALVKTDPKLDQVLKAAGFMLDRSEANAVGSWMKDDVAVDLMVPASIGGSGRRSARIDGQARNIIRKTHGLEACLIDNDLMEVISFSDENQPTTSIKVAGPAGLMVAKLLKIEERTSQESSGQSNRVNNKDSLDIFRLLHYEPTDLKNRLNKVINEPLSAQAAKQALDYFEKAFGHPDSIGCIMAADAARGYADPDEIRMRASILTKRLISSLA